ncbi:MAG: potassium channel protein [Deltaproteobacteria bacterium]|nr:potassium channel protein [Deltaproteobacteria bacterium]MBW2388076.1 potassium channel protein [Deltaproteobacteria bacterium]
MQTRPRILLAIGYLVLLTAFGAAGFVFLEGMDWTSAIYLSVVTISTVGFGDITPVTPAGRFFTLGLIATGVGTAFYLISVIAQDVLEGRLREFVNRSSMMREIKKHGGHVIVCGYGRFGCVVVGELQRVGRSVVVIEEDASHEPDLVLRDIDFIIGSAADDDTLIAAGIHRADAIVVGTSTDATSVFITLSARELNPEIRIHARGESDSAIRRLTRAGANFVTSPYQMGGLRTAASILRPSVVDFLDLSHPKSRTEIDLEEVRVEPGSEVLNRTVGELEADYTQLRIIALKRSDQTIELVPDANVSVLSGDHMVVIGEREQLLGLARQALGASSR